MIRRTLLRSGYTVLTAADGEFALATARAHSGPIDLFVTDVIMPNLGGAEAARILVLERPGTEFSSCRATVGENRSRPVIQRKASHICESRSTPKRSRLAWPSYSANVSAFRFRKGAPKLAEPLR